MVGPLHACIDLVTRSNENVIGQFRLCATPMVAFDSEGMTSVVTFSPCVYVKPLSTYKP